MSRFIRCGMLMVLFGSALAAEDPLEKRPQWQRSLSKEDEKKVEELNDQIENHLAADRYSQAIPLQEEVFAIRLRTQGKDHWETRDEQWGLARLRKIAALSPDQRRAWREAERIDRESASQEEQGRFRQVFPARQQFLLLCQKVLGEEDPETARSYNNLAFNLDSQGKSGEALPLYYKALEIHRKGLGEEHPSTATSINNVAGNLFAQGKIAEALPLYQRSLQICRNVLGDTHPTTALGYNNLGLSLSEQGKSAEALPFLQKAMEIHRQALGEEDPSTADIYNNLAATLSDLGNPVEAESYLQKALQINRKVLGEDHPSTATNYNNLGINRKDQGKYAEAEPLLQRALEIRRRVQGENHPITAANYHNLASNLEMLGKHLEALTLYQKALAIQREALDEDHPHTALSYFHLAMNRQAQGQYAEALQALESARRSYETARIAVAAPGLDRAHLGAQQSPYPFLAASRARAGKDAEAFAALEANLARGFLDEQGQRRGGLRLLPAEEQQQQTLNAKLGQIHARLLSLSSRQNLSPAERQERDAGLAERSRLSRQLAELAAGVSQREVASLSDIQAALPPDTALVAWVDAADKSSLVQEHWGCVLRREGPPAWQRLPGSGPQGKWTQEDLDLPGHLLAVLRKKGTAEEIQILAQRLAGQRLAPLARYLQGAKRLIVVGTDWMAGVPVELLTKDFAIHYNLSGTQLVRQRARPRPEGSTLLALGDPIYDPDGRDSPGELPPGGLLILRVAPGGAADQIKLQPDDVLLSYAGKDLQSLDQLRVLFSERDVAKTVPIKVWRRGIQEPIQRELPVGKLGVVFAKDPAVKVLGDRRKADLLVTSATRGKEWQDLPGTRVELIQLRSLFGEKAHILADESASEKRLEDLRKNGDLAKFRYLHFATHGEANPDRALESALILTQQGLSKEPRVGEKFYDGRLTAREVLEGWKLDADLVTLSACETALGRSGGGDGLLGFAQAFLMAGSRSVCLSLWKVDDAATVLLMDRFYRNLLEKKMAKGAALAEAKTWLRELSSEEALQRTAALTNGVVRGKGQKAGTLLPAVPMPMEKGTKPYAHPRYWAAFILIGEAE